MYKVNILRKLRRLKKQSLQTKIRLICIFSVMLITVTYAWFTSAGRFKTKNLEANIDSWDVQYVIKDGENAEITPTDDELLEKEFTMTMQDIYPGVADTTKRVKIYNTAKVPSEIYVEITSVKLFGEELIGKLAEKGAIKYYDESKKVRIFETEDYPFDIGYTYDKKIIQGQYNSETDTTAKAEFNFDVNWIFNGENDNLDTQIGKKAYEYYQANNNDVPALEIKVKIVARKYEPYKNQ